MKALKDALAFIEAPMLKCYDSVINGPLSRFSFRYVCVIPTAPLDAPCGKNVALRP